MRWCRVSRAIGFLLAGLFWLSACQPQPARLPATPTGNGTTLPLVVQSITEITETATPFQPSSPVLDPTSAPTDTPAPTYTAIPTETLAPTPLPRITLLFTGIIVPARCVQAAIDERGDANYVYDEVRDLIQGADLAVGTLNTTLSDRTVHTGCGRTTYLLVSDSRSAAAAAEAGFDVMSVATNHIKNCSSDVGLCDDGGDAVFLDTLNNLRAVGILPVGGGANLAEAMQPVVVNVQGVRFGIVSLGYRQDPWVDATDERPGVARLTDDSLRSAIAAARAVSDVVIAMPHWGPEETPNPSEDQLHFAQVAVEAGADLVVGNHTHVVQAIEQINGIDVFFGLGNFVFDQTWDLAHQQSVILLAHFEGTTYLGYELIPAHVDGDGTVHLAGEEEAAQILQRIQEASDRLK